MPRGGLCVLLTRSSWQTHRRVNEPTTVLTALVAAGSDDARAVWSIVALLAVLGVGLAMLAVALVRLTRPDPELLAPLEVMGNRKWRRSDPVWQRRQLDAVRPADAQPLTTSPATPVPLEGFEEGPAAGGFDDLADLGSGVANDLTELPGGVVFDADPTPPSGEVPVVVLGDPPPADVSLASLAIDWGAPALEDLAIAGDAPQPGVEHGVPAEPAFVAADPDAVAEDDTWVVGRPNDADQTEDDPPDDRRD